MSEVIEECLENAEIYFPKHLNWSKKNSISRLKWRRRDRKRVSRGVMKRYGEAFRDFESSLAGCDFVNNSLINAYCDRRDQDSDQRVPPLLGTDSVGGYHLRVLLLLGMHARSIRLGTEILLLMKEGHPEAAASRARTLYELTVKMMIICSDNPDSDWELAERYYVSAQLEEYSKGELFSDNISGVEAELRDAALARWGKYFFSGQNNWAAPAVAGGISGKITFRQMEEAVGAEEIRHIYREFNHAVHAGAKSVIESTDFRKTYLNNCRGEVNIKMTGRVGHSVAFFLKIGTMEVSRRLTSDLEEWDWGLSVIHFLREINKANKGFSQVYKSKV
ncbi:DUF5677 domain-containing protein [Nocardiopsis sp. NPDC058789]|uniref:DUF5677 domain-containing protein n=1 Tax=Nocardiopsis sp. NPDC058789 TaxID=3346634 RepID=UPI003671CD62